MFYWGSRRNQLDGEPKGKSYELNALFSANDTNLQSSPLLLSKLLKIIKFHGCEEQNIFWLP